MWIFTRYGFYSIACARHEDGTVDPGTVMIRARRITHLQNLQKRFPALTESEITTLPDRDYRYRIIAAKSAWVPALAELGQEQEWSNFKNEVANYQGNSDHEYHDALHDVWSVMYKLQRRTAGS